MNFIKIAVLAAIVVAVGCNKGTTSCTNVSIESEIPVITAYNDSKGIGAIKGETGVFYKIINEGGAKKPNLNSRIYIKYRGEKLDGTVFDQATNPGTTGFYLSSLIQGWKDVIPKIGKGGKLQAIIPSSLAYGCKGSSNTDSAKAIPANSPLFFEIEMEDFY